MLALNLGRIRSPHERFERVYEPADCAAADDSFGIVAPVALDFDVFKDKDRYRLAGSVRTGLELTCSRCLDPFPWPVDARFDLLYQPKAAAGVEGEREVGESDFGTAFYENDAIDLAQLVREQLYLAVPMKPLCRETCLGLCPVCGTNLNRGLCGCRRDWDDPRFAALRALKPDR
jgi:uncharacterized protein